MRGLFEVGKAIGERRSIQRAKMEFSETRKSVFQQHANTKTVEHMRAAIDITLLDRQ